MGRFAAWISHREPGSPQLTGFWGQFTDNGMSAQISAHGLDPVPGGDRQAAYRTMIEQLANALLGTEDNPIAITESLGAPEFLFQGDPPYDLPPAQSAEAQAVDENVEMTLRVIVPGKLPAPAPIRVMMTRDTARALSGQMAAAATAAEIRAARRR